MVNRRETLAVSASSTISYIFLRMNSDIISFEFSSRIISSKLSLKLNPPFPNYSQELLNALSRLFHKVFVVVLSMGDRGESNIFSRHISILDINSE